jgi:hypothetical protein
MASWADFMVESPVLGAVAGRLWSGIAGLDRGDPPRADTPPFAIAYLASVRPDGAPRLHPFCPILADGRLFAAIPPSSPKGHDLRRDPRCVVHALPGPDDDELCVRATAREVTGDEATRAAVRKVVARSGVDGMMRSVGSHPLFELDPVQVDVAVWLDVGKATTRVVRRRWRAR